MNEHLLAIGAAAMFKHSIRQREIPAPGQTRVGKSSSIFIGHGRALLRASISAEALWRQQPVRAAGIAQRLEVHHGSCTLNAGRHPGCGVKRCVGVGLWLAEDLGLRTSAQHCSGLSARFCHIPAEWSRTVLVCLTRKRSRRGPNDANTSIITAIYGGRGGIRTHGGLAPSAVFKTAALNHSATRPSLAFPALSLAGLALANAAAAELLRNELVRWALPRCPMRRQHTRPHPSLSAMTLSRISNGMAWEGVRAAAFKRLDRPTQEMDPPVDDALRRRARGRLINPRRRVPFVPRN